MDNYTILHLHSDYSNGTTNIDSVTNYQDYIDKAKEYGMKALAFTEHGNVYSWLSKKNACEKVGIKYIHGAEIYITESLEEKTRDNYHTVLLARNYEGFKEINSLISLANNREDGHFYYVPRISMDDFCNISDNIIVTSACLGGVLGRGTNTARKRYLDYFTEHKDRCFLEIQHHNVEDQIEHNKRLKIISEKLGIRLVVGTDTHSLDETKARGREMLQKSKGIFFGDEGGWDLTMKSHQELIEAYSEQCSLDIYDVIEAIENTNVIADMVEEFSVDKSNKYPKMAENPKLELQKQIVEGIQKRGVNKLINAKKYAERILEEMDVYEYNGAFDYMLLTSDVKSFCDKNGIRVGYGRGSVTGSIVAYLLGITEMDSVKHKLNFFRFMSKERVSLPDIDVDYPKSRRQEVRDYLFSKDNVYCSDIVTFNTIALKGAIKDIGRALGMSVVTTQEISDNCYMNDKKEQVIDDSWRQEYPTLFEYIDIVVGTIVSVGIHASGVMVSPIPLDDSIGTYTSKDTPYPISQLQMKEIDSLNFVKLDILGLDAVDVIGLTCDFSGIDYITPDTIDDEDDNVWNDLSETTEFVFQMESNVGKSYCKKLFSPETISKIKEKNPKLKRINLLSMGNGAIRPSGESYRDLLANGDFVSNGHEALDDFLVDTNGFIIFQEQIMEFLHEFCGFSMGEADVTRKHIAKKLGTKEDIPKIKAGFIKYMEEKYEMSKFESENLIESFLRVVEDASNYGFSLNHSQAYSYIGYAEAWLKHYYPIEFATAYFTAKQSSSKGQEDMVAMTKWCKERGITISLPKYGKAKGEFSFDKELNTIYKGTTSIKSVNKDVGDKLFEFYQSHKYLDNLLDILISMADEKVSGKGNLLILAKLGFFSNYGSNKKVVEFITNFFDGKGVKYDSSYADKTKEKRVEALKTLWEELPNDDFNILEQIVPEMEYLGYGETTYPNIPPEIHVVSMVEEKNWCTVLNCFNVSNGLNSTMHLTPKNRVGIKKLKDYGILRIDETREDKQGRLWIQSFTLLQ